RRCSAPPRVRGRLRRRGREPEPRHADDRRARVAVRGGSRRDDDGDRDDIPVARGDGADGVDGHGGGHPPGGRPDRRAARLKCVSWRARSRPHPLVAPAALSMLTAPARGDRPGDNKSPMVELLTEILDASLTHLMAEARSLRRAPMVTYSPKVFIPLTTLCRDVCGYCTFA